jgi:formylglycine-generating enzyme required for sulfatase activity
MTAISKVKDAFSAIAAEIRSVTDRQAMGQPETYTIPEAESLTNAAAEIYGTSPRDLAGIVESRELSVDLRLTAGILLGLVGDPRIQLFEPEMLAIPGGVVPIGLAPECVEAIAMRYQDRGVKREWIEKEAPRHFIELRPYRIAKYMITNAEFAAFLHATGYDELPTSWSFGRFHPALSNHPVHTVSQAASAAYAAWLSGTTGRRFRLPREAEWEYAAAGPDSRTFPWGEFAVDCANTLESGLLMPTPVGCFPKGASCFGALDMAGNVEEWTADLYGPYPDGRAVADDLTDLAAERNYHVCRGGAFTRFQDLARCQRRHGPVGIALYPISFRLAEDV